MTLRIRQAPVAGDSSVLQSYFLVIDTRFAAPVFVFLNADPSGAGGYLGPPARRVTLALMDMGGSVKPSATIGSDPWAGGQYAEFASDGAARAAGFAPVEPRYVGPDWASYSSIFHPEGTKPIRSAANPFRRPLGRNGSAHR